MTEQTNQTEPESLSSKIVRVILIFIGVGAAFVVGKHFVDKYNARKRIGQ